MTEDRREPRLPISLSVGWRTTGAFLVSYSINLSKGGIFLETTEPLAVGEPLTLEFDVPGAGTLRVDGVVAWVRQGSTDGMPDGMGIQFQELDERYGERIDALVRDFVGLTVLVVAASPDRLALLGRYVRSIITCEIVEATSTQVAEVALEEKPDLVVVDLDVRPDLGMRTIAAARAQSQTHGSPIPIILLAADGHARERGKAAGADEALATPPSYHELQAAVIRMLSRPAQFASTSSSSEGA
jgi:type IV pilus assembly protein PilZ